MSRLAAETTAAACRRPGCRERRSSGPGDRHGGDDPARRPAHGRGHRRDADLALGHRLRPAAATDAGQDRGGELGALQAAVQAVGLLPGEQDLRGGARVHGQGGADRDRVAQADRPLGGGDADALVTLAAVELRALAGVVAQRGEHGAGGGEQAVLAGGRRELREARSEHEPALHVARDQAVVLERHGQPVGRRASKMGGGDELRERGRPGLESAENGCGLVQHADSARVVHRSILASRRLRCKYDGRRAGKTTLPDEVRTRERTEKMAGTLAEKVWDAHVVRRGTDGAPDLLYIDLHLVHEVTSPQAFEGLRLAGRPVRRPDLTLATEDHNTPTLDIDRPIADETSRTQIQTLRNNAAEFGVRIHSLGDADQGIVHQVGPQLGLTQPGLTVVCGDSHTSTHGAFGALAFGIGTSEVEHVLATQTLPLAPFKTMAITVDGALPPGATSKDIILAIIAKIGTGGGQGYVLEYRGEAIRALSMEARMTVCNMSIEAGARAGMIAPDQTTFDYLKGRPHAPEGADWDAAVDVLEHAEDATTTPSSTSRSSSRPRTSSRSSPGAPTPARACRCPARCRCPSRSPTPTSAAPPSGPSSTWA